MLPASLIASVLAKAVSTLHASAALQFTIVFMLISGIVGAALVRNREERRLRDALIDPLTGAFNRRHFQMALRVASERQELTSEPASLIVFDVDHFKTVNETFGHTAGDAVLKTLVTIVARRIRLVDVVCRTGGDEFAALLSNATAGDAMTVAEDLRALVEQTLLLNGRRVSISGGVSELKRGLHSRSAAGSPTPTRRCIKPSPTAAIGLRPPQAGVAGLREHRRVPFAPTTDAT